MNDQIEFVKLGPILERDCHYSVMFGTRSDGKTYAVLEYAWKKFLEDGSTLALIRRWDEDFVGANSARNCYNSLINNAFGKNIIREYSHDEYVGVEYYGGKYYLQTEDEDGKVHRTDKVVAYGLSLNSAEHYKSASFPDVRTVLFDEFIATKIYLQSEFVLFCNLLSTIIRVRDDVRIFLCGNTINKYNPYFSEMGLYKAKDMRPGEIDVYQYGESGLKVCCYYTDGQKKNKKKSNVYFAFDNPRLQMITTGAWELDIYKHLKPEMKYRPKDILLSYFIHFDEQMFQAEVIVLNGSAFTYIHRKTGEIKYPDKDIVFDPDGDDYRVNHRRQINRDVLPWVKRLWRFYVEDKVYYQDNEVGNTISAYLSLGQKG